MPEVEVEVDEWWSLWTQEVRHDRRASQHATARNWFPAMLIGTFIPQDEFTAWNECSLAGAACHVAVGPWSRR